MDHSTNRSAEPDPTLARQAAEALADRLEKVATSWRDLRKGSEEREALITLHHRLGSLEGAARRAGQHRLAHTAAVAEERILTFAEGVRPLGGDALSRLHDIMEDILSWQLDPARAAVPAATACGPKATDSLYDPRLIAVLDHNPEERSQLMEQLRLFGYQAQAFATQGDMISALGSARPDACIVDAVTLVDSSPGGKGLEDLQGTLGWSCPMVVVAEDDTLMARTAAVRGGAEGFFGKPIHIDRLMGRLDTLTSRPMDEPYRALVVDDDGVTARIHAKILSSIGVQVNVLLNPAELLDALERLRPELVLMDVYMPEYHGAELAEVIRQHELYTKIPVVFLSGETDERLQIAALRRGGQDFLTKPVQPRHLISSVLHLARRYRSESASESRDPVTGLLNHSALQAALRNQLHEAEGPVAFVLLDIEGLAPPTDRFGNTSGDGLLRRMGQLMQRRLGSAAIIGRYKGDVFGAILPGGDSTYAQHRVNMLRERLKEARHEVGDQTFVVGLNAGVAVANPGDASEDLMARAEQALRDSHDGEADNAYLANV